MTARGVTSRRGYGWPHQRLRAVWARRVNEGGVSCARCGKPIAPGQAFDLDHSDHPRAKELRLYNGASHRACNRASGAHKAQRRAKAGRPRAKALDWFL
jgi:hypothetical protein